MLVWIQNPFDNLPGEGFRKQRYWMMAEAFVRAGHRVVLWTADFSHALKARREAPAQAPGISVRLVPTRQYAKNVSFDRVASHLDYARAWRNLAINEPERPALVVTSLPTISAAAAAVCFGREIGAKTVVDVQDVWPGTFLRLAPRMLRPLARLALGPLEAKARRVLRTADRVTGVCDAYCEAVGRADYFRAYLGIELAPMPADSRRPCNRQRKVHLVYAGGLGRTYGLKAVIDAVAANLEMELDLAGFGAAPDIPPSAAGRIRFHGALGAEALGALLAAADIGVVPMAAESGVGLPNKIFDYAAAGLGIVSSLGGESSALLARYRCGTDYLAGDQASFTAAVRKALTLAPGASRQLCEEQFDARKIYDGYVAEVTG